MTRDATSPKADSTQTDAEPQKLAAARSSAASGLEKDLADSDQPKGAPVDHRIQSIRSESQQRFIVRGLTQVQANELARSLQAEPPLPINAPNGEVGDTPLHTDSGRSMPTPSTGPSISANGLSVPVRQNAVNDALLWPGDVVSIEVRELIAPGVTPLLRQTIGENGTIKLQMIPAPVTAAGLTTRQLQQTVAERYRDANLILNPTVEVRRISATSQPADADSDDRVNLIVIVRPPATAPSQP